MEPNECRRPQIPTPILFESQRAAQIHRPFHLGRGADYDFAKAFPAAELKRFLKKPATDPFFSMGGGYKKTAQDRRPRILRLDPQGADNPMAFFSNEERAVGTVIDLHEFFQIIHGGKRLIGRKLLLKNRLYQGDDLAPVRLLSGSNDG